MDCFISFLVLCILRRSQLKCMKSTQLFFFELFFNLSVYTRALTLFDYLPQCFRRTSFTFSPERLSLCRENLIVFLVVYDSLLSSSHFANILSIRYLWRSIGDIYIHRSSFSFFLSKSVGLSSENLYFRPFGLLRHGVSKVDGEEFSQNSFDYLYRRSVSRGVFIGVNVSFNLTDGDQFGRISSDPDRMRFIFLLVAIFIFTILKLTFYSKQIIDKEKDDLGRAFLLYSMNKTVDLIPGFSYSFTFSL